MKKSIEIKPAVVKYSHLKEFDIRRVLKFE